MEGPQCYSISLLVDEATGCFAAPDLQPIADLEGIHEKYFADVFSKKKADKLAPHRPYNLKIDIEEGANPPLGSIYPLSQSKLTAIQEF